MRQGVPRRALALEGVQLVMLLVLPLGLAGTAPAAARPLLPEAAPAHTSTGAVEPGVLALLRRSFASQSSLGYAGTQLVSTWDDDGTASAVLDVLHEPGEGMTTWPHGADASDPPQPVAGAVTVPDEPDGASWVGPAGAKAPLDVLLARYDVTAGGSTEVAGRSAHRLDLRRDGTLAARLWLDAETGLVLRREVYDGAGRTVQAMSYLELDVTSPPGVSAVPADGPADVRSPGADVPAARSAGVAQLRRQGWRCPDELAGLPLHDARTMATSAQSGGSADATVLHLTYTDGLSTLSLYQQRGRLDRAALAGYLDRRVAGHDISVQLGLATRAVWDAGDMVLTVVAERPDEQLPAVVAALPPAPAASRGWMSTAAQRVLAAARWITPLR